MIAVNKSETVAWIKGDAYNNWVLYAPDKSFYISFVNQKTGPWSTLETAIVADSILILDGDHREAYEGLIGNGLEACIEYYNKHEDQWSTWTEEVTDKKELEDCND